MRAILDLSPLRSVARATHAPVHRPYDASLQGRLGLRALRGGPTGIAVRVSAAEAGALIEVLAAGEVSPDEVQEAIAIGRGLVGLDDDPSGFDALARAHPLVAKLHARFPGARLRRTPTVWESFAGAVIGQLVTAGEAQLSVRRLHGRHGQEIPGTGLRAFPTARTMATLPAFELRAMGIGIRRATTLLGAARLGDRFESLRKLPIDRAMKWMDDLRGVGPWTINTVAIEALDHADGVLVGDAGLPRTVTLALSGREGGDAEMLACLEPFRPHRARVVRLIELAGRETLERAGVPARRKPTIDPHRRFPWRY
jgi:3-methyladenine DNA glycosylase/8-oxoguanine DNA glycosylase